MIHFFSAVTLQSQFSVSCSELQIFILFFLKLINLHSSTATASLDSTRIQSKISLGIYQ